MATRKPAGALLDHLDKEGPRPIYAIDGDERVLVDEAVRAIKARTLSGRANDFNFDSFVVPEASPQRIADAAQQLPVFAERRLVLVKNAEKIPADGADPLIAYAANPSPSTVLVLIAAEKFDARTKLYKALEKAGAALRFSHPSEREMPQVIRERARKIGAQIDDGGVRRLIDAVGTDVGLVSEALEKLALYVGPGATRAITGQDVDVVVSLAREESVFELTDALGRSDVPAAFSALHAMTTISGEHPLRLLAVLARHVKQLATVRARLDARLPPAEVTAGLGVPPFIADKLVAQARRQPLAKLVRGLSAIADVDQALKGGRLAHDRVMERLILTLARG